MGKPRKEWEPKIIEEKNPLILSMWKVGIII